MEEDSDPDYAVPPKKRVRQLPRSQLQSTSAESVEVVAHVEQGLVEVDSSASADVHPRRASKRLQNKLFTDPASCVICQLVKKPGYDRSGKKNRRRSETPHKCTSLNGALLAAALVRKDERLLLHLSGRDDVAADVLFHRTCYQRYTNARDLKRLEKDKDEDIRTTYDNAFSRLVDEITGPILGEERIFTFPLLRARYSELLQEQTGQLSATFSGNWLRRRLVEHFGDRMVWYKEEGVGQPWFLYGPHVPLARVAILMQQLQESIKEGTDEWHDNYGRSTGNDDDDEDEDDEDVADTHVGTIGTATAMEDYEERLSAGDDLHHPGSSRSTRNSARSSSSARESATSHLFHAATIIRTDVAAIVDSMPWPPSPDDISERNTVVPASLYNLLAWIQTGSDDVPPAGQRLAVKNADDHRRVLSIAQDVIFCARKGRVKPPKHIALPLAVYHLTRSKQIVSLLNGFGHGISASQLAEIDTALAQRELDNSTDANTVLPSNISTDLPADFCYDNFDVLEETRTGGRTTHVTNGIVIQRTPDEGTISTARCGGDTTSSRQSLHHKRSLRITTAVDPIPYYATKRCGPRSLPFDEGRLVEAVVFPECVQRAISIDFLWSVTRLPAARAPMFGSDHQVQVIPSWTPFNALLHADDIPRRSNIGYCPVINAPPTELSTVYKVLESAAAMAKYLPQQDVVVVFDQAVYAKAQEILWKQVTPLANVVVRMGAFHTSMTLLAIIGKRFGDSGLRDLMVGSDVVADGSVDIVLNGKQYNRAVRLHKTCAEALFRLQWSEFEQAFDKLDFPIEIDVSACKQLLTTLRGGITPASASVVLASAGYQSLEACFRHFCSMNTSPMAIFWQSYIDMVFLLLRFIRATREANWTLHLHCIRQILPWAFAYDRVNYARYLSAYYYEMQCLAVTHPDAHMRLQRGEFAVQRSDKAFAQVAVDHSIEQSINRDMKTSGGVIGITQDVNAVQRWTLTAHHRAEFTRQCRNLAAHHGRIPEGDGDNDAGNDLPTLATHPLPAGCRKDERDVERVCSYVDGLRENIFAVHEDPKEQRHLVGLSSGIVAPSDVEHDLIHAHAKGTAAMTTFFNERLLSSEKDFFDTLPSQKLKTFTSVLHPTKSRRSNSHSMARADRNVFSQLTNAATQGRTLDMKDVLSYELGTLPWALATADGELQKTTKAKLAQLLESDHQPVQPPLRSVVVHDGMAMLKKLVPSGRTFADVSLQVFNMISRGSLSGKRVDFVIDRYPDVSIKNLERRQRAAAAPPVVVQIQNRDQKLPRDWNSYLNSGANKTSFIAFILGEWQRPEYAPRIAGGSLFLCHGSLCSRLTSSDGQTIIRQDVPSLTCQQEEADTRLFLHAHHAATRGDADHITISSPDTDVFVLGCALALQIPAHMFWQTGTKQRKRYVDVTAIASALGEDVCKALPGMHAFTGCDTTSCFAGQGKKTALDMLKGGECDAMKQIGSSSEVSDETMKLCEDFVCRLYSKKTSADGVNDLRHKMFTANPMTSSHKLPPTRDALLLHTARANYQALIWRKALDASFAPPSPHGHGWEVKESVISIVWMSQPAAPQALLALTRCGCSTGCESQRCSCRKKLLPCTSACNCKDCHNKTPTQVDASAAAADAGHADHHGVDNDFSEAVETEFGDDSNCEYDSDSDDL